MKSIVSHNCLLLISSVFLIGCLSSLRAGRSCECENPPGGRITCPEGQIPVCTIVDGSKVHGECKLPPKEQSTGLALRAWLLSEILQKPIRPEDITRTKELQDILSAGRYVDRERGRVVTFTLPNDR